MRLHIVTLALSGCVIATAGCSSSSTEPAAVRGVSAGATRPAAKALALTADQVAKALKTRGLPVRNIIAYDQNTDPNKLLGQPGQYTSKVYFKDPRAKTNLGVVSKDVIDGGSVEVFDKPGDVLTRVDYITTGNLRIQTLGEHDFVAGGVVLLRLSGDLTSSQVRQYTNALKAIVGMPMVTPSPTHT